MNKIKINGPATARQIEALAGKSPFEMYVSVYGGVTPEPQIKDRILEAVNAERGTSYKRRHMDNWLSGRQVMPRGVEGYLNRQVMIALLGEDAVYCLRKMFN